MTWHRMLVGRSPGGLFRGRFPFKMRDLHMLKLCLFAVIFISAITTCYLFIASGAWRYGRKINDNKDDTEQLSMKVANQAVQSAKNREVSQDGDTAVQNKSLLEQKINYERRGSQQPPKGNHKAHSLTKAPIEIRQSQTKLGFPRNASANIVTEVQTIRQNQTLSVQKRRRENMQKACDGIFHIPALDLKSKVPLDTVFRATVLSSTLVNDDFNLTVTTTTGVSSTNWRRFMLDLRLRSSRKFRERWPAAWALNKRTDAEAKHCLGHYTKVLIVRNPLVRLLQAFRDQFLQPRSSFYVKKARTIINSRRGTKLASDSLQQPRLTFLEFLRYIADGKHGTDPHWRPIFQTSKPCKVRYDFIGKMETLQHDADYLIDKLGLKGRIKFRFLDPHARLTPNTGMLVEYYSRIPPEVVEKVREIYQEDFIAFDYPLPDSSNLTAYFQSS